MSRRTMDLRPESIRRRVDERRERGLLVRCSIIGGVVLIAAWGSGAWRLSAAKAHQRVAESHAATVLGVERELQDVEAAVDRLGDELSAWRSVTIPFGPTAVVHGILDGLPASATVERLEFYAGSLITPSGRTVSSRTETERPARRLQGELEGFAASDEDVVSLVESLRAVPFFLEVKVERTWHRDLQGDPARAFRLGFEVDLEAASPAPIKSSPEASS